VIYGVNYAPESTGIGPYTRDLARALVADGHRVKAIVGVAHYPQWATHQSFLSRSSTSIEDGVEVTRVPLWMPNVSSPKSRALFELSFFVRSLGIRVGKADVVVGIVPALTGLMLAARKRAPRRVALFQDLVGRGLIQSGLARNERLARIVTRCEGGLAARMHAVAVVAPSFMEALTEAGVPHSRLVLTPNWPRCNDPARPVSGIRDRLGVSADAVIALHAGSMGAKQGLSNLIEAARLSRDVEPHLVWVLTGDGGEGERLRALAAGLDNVCFTGVLSDDDLGGLLAEASVVLVSQSATNHDMSMPSKLWTYFAAQRPIVASVPAAGTSGQFLADVDAAVLVEPGNPAELVAAVNHLASDLSLSNQLVANAARYLDEQMSRPAMVGALVDVVTGAPSSN
jgi:colanic acid biosynthesis glycosyl transferase WcaI